MSLANGIIVSASVLSEGENHLFDIDAACERRGHIGGHAVERDRYGEFGDMLQTDESRGSELGDIVTDRDPGDVVTVIVPRRASETAVVVHGTRSADL